MPEDRSRHRSALLNDELHQLRAVLRDAGGDDTGLSPSNRSCQCFNLTVSFIGRFVKSLSRGSRLCRIQTRKSHEQPC